MTAKSVRLSVPKARTMRAVARWTPVYIVLTIVSLAFMAPFVWTVGSSLKSPTEVFRFPPAWLPEVPQWHNYAKVMDQVPFLEWTANSLYISIMCVVGTMISASMVAFSLARFDYPFRDVILLIILGTMMLPVEVTIIPSFLLFHKLGWLNTFKPLIIPAWLGGGAFNIFMLRQFFMTLPRELDEAAYIDGATPVRIFWQIVLPLSKPALLTVAVIGYISNWNRFMEPIIYLNDAEKFPLSVGLRYFDQGFNAMYSSEPMEHLLMAASTMMLMPCLFLFFVAQRYFVRGIVMTGIKE